MSTLKKALQKLKFVPILLCLLFVLIFLLTRKNLSVEWLLNYSPESPVLAAMLLLCFYAAKSLSIFFPMMVLQILGGHLFSTPVAMVLNIVGMVIILALPYGVGRFSGADTLDQLRQKYPKLESAVEHQQQDCFFVCFFLRVISILPGDIVSMYFGATKTPFKTYLWGSSLGTVPGVITSTLIGSSLSEPDSPLFWFSLFLTVFLSVISWLLHHFHQKKKAQK